MKRSWTWIAAASLLVSSGCAAAYSRTPVGAGASYTSSGEAASVSDFYGALSPYGRWLEYPGYGWCWAPNVSADWRPYSEGRWAYTEYGWTWLSSEPWGWATFHYGRWWFDPATGWVWVPDPVWGPAWVTWQYGPGWIGWAALPPEDAWNASAGIEATAVIPVSSWCFVDEDRVFDRDLSSRIRPSSLNARLLHGTTEALRYTALDGVPVNDGIDIERIERETGRRVERLRAERRPGPVHPEASRDGRPVFFRPELRPARAGDRPPSAPPARRPDADIQRQQHVAAARHRLEQTLAAERARMQHQHDVALRSKSDPAERHVLEQRQAEERKQFESYAARQRDDFERRVGNRGSQPPAPQASHGPKPGSGKGHGNGEGG